MMALNDRLKLRSMVVGEKGDRVYVASEECAIRTVEPELDRLWSPRGSAGESLLSSESIRGCRYKCQLITMFRNMMYSAIRSAASLAAYASASAQTKSTLLTRIPAQ
jgi:hypothetical protein